MPIAGSQVSRFPGFQLSAAAFALPETCRSRRDHSTSTEWPPNWTQAQFSHAPDTRLMPPPETPAAIGKKSDLSILAHYGEVTCCQPARSASGDTFSRNITPGRCQ